MGYGSPVDGILPPETQSTYGTVLVKRFFVKITRLYLLIAILLLVAAALLACGPGESLPEEHPGAQPASQESEATPAPTPDPTPTSTLTPTPTLTTEPPKYPNLDIFLRDLVAKYEAGELSETAAAARAPIYHEGSIFVDIRFSTDAAAVARWREETGLTHIWPYVDDTEGWLGENQSEAVYRPDPYQKPFIYAYVPVSKLGALSQREGVTLVEALPGPGRVFCRVSGRRGRQWREHRGGRRQTVVSLRPLHADRGQAWEVGLPV